MRIPNYNRLYKLDDLSDRAFRVTSNSAVDGDTVIKLLRGEIENPPLISYYHYMGSKIPTDIIPTGTITLLISERVLDILESNNISGYFAYKVKVFGSRLEHYDSYYGLSITGRCNAIDLHRGVIEHIGDWKVPVIKGAFFKDDYWDGSDFFMELPDERGSITARIFTSEKVMRLFREYRVKNVGFEKLINYTTDLNLIRRIKAYRLPESLR